LSFFETEFSPCLERTFKSEFEFEHRERDRGSIVKRTFELLGTSLQEKEINLGWGKGQWLFAKRT